MKTTIISILLMILCQVVFSEKPIKIKGHIDGIENAELQIMILPWKDGANPIIDYVSCKNGKFEFQADTEYELWHMVVINGNKFNEIFGKDKCCDEELKNRDISFLMQPGDHAIVDAKFENFGIYYTVKGNEINETRNEFEKTLFPFFEDYNKLIIEKSKYKNDTLKDHRQNLAKKINDLKNQIQRLEIKLIQDNPKSLYSAYLLQTSFQDDTISRHYENLDNDVKISFWGKNLYDRISKAPKHLSAPGFSMLNEKNQQITLSDFQGKYVLLEFWGPWCSACVKDVPKMNEIQLRFKDQLAIMGICCNSDQEAWRNALKKYSINWVNLFSGSQEIVERYGVKAFPTKVLIDKEGKVIAKSIGIADNFYEKMNDLIK